MQKETILNPAPARELPEDIYRCVDHLILNETEAAMLSQTPENDLILKLESVTGTFIQRGVHNVIITLGSRVSCPCHLISSPCVGLNSLALSPRRAFTGARTFMSKAAHAASKSVPDR